MSGRISDKAPERGRDLREIPTWARRYAQNRTLTVLVSLGIFVAAFVAFAGLSSLTVWAYITGRRVVAALSAVALSGFAAWWLWFSLVGGGRILRSITDRAYRREGSVSVGPPEQATGRAPHFVGFLFASCIIAHVALGFLGFLPIRYMQPISALYVVPSVVYLGMRLRHIGSPFMWLWPALYAIHAILLVAGAPIYFGGKYEGLNMFVPVVGYGVVAALAGHLYGRIALRRLRALARSPELEGGTGEARQ